MRSFLRRFRHACDYAPPTFPQRISYFNERRNSPLRLSGAQIHTQRWTFGCGGEQHLHTSLEKGRRAAVRLRSRSIILLNGLDAAKFLQGAITHNVQPFSPSDSSQVQNPFYSAFLNPQGRVLYDVFIYPFVGDQPSQAAERSQAGVLGFLIDVDTRGAEALRKWIAKYRLRSRFDVAILPDWEVWQLWGAWTADVKAAFPQMTTGRHCVDVRSKGMGHRIVVPGNEAEMCGGLSSRDETEYLVHRYLLGVAEGVKEIIPGHSLPLESNLDLMSAIDFRKGCYVGQELTIRTKHSGVVRKRILPLVFGSEAYSIDPAYKGIIESKDGTRGVLGLPEVGSDLQRMDSEHRTKTGGKFLAGVGNLGLGLCRLDVLSDRKLEDGENASVSGPNLIAATQTQVRAWRPPMMTILES